MTHIEERLTTIANALETHSELLAERRNIANASVSIGKAAEELRKLAKQHSEQIADMSKLACRDCEIDKLKAHVEALKQSIYFYLQSDSPETESERWVSLHDLLQLTPAQCLAARDAEVKAQAIAEFADGVISHFEGCNYNLTRQTLKCYLHEQLRQRAKELNNG